MLVAAAGAATSARSSGTSGEPGKRCCFISSAKQLSGTHLQNSAVLTDNDWNVESHTEQNVEYITWASKVAALSLERQTGRVHTLYAGLRCTELQAQQNINTWSSSAPCRTTIALPWRASMGSASFSSDSMSGLARELSTATVRPPSLLYARHTCVEQCVTHSRSRVHLYSTNNLGCLLVY